MDHEPFFTWWETSAQIQPNITAIREIAPAPGKFASFPDGLSGSLCAVLQNLGISALYTHQVESFQSALEGKNPVITTGTSSGKTLCYTLPILNRLIRDNTSKAIFIFPTKALAQDQLKSLQALIAELNRVSPESRAFLTPDLVNVYDGDTASDARTAIRARARILITNPDMLHIGILPHHTLWQALFQGLDFLVLDEIHLYRGVFGSHVANVIRRLKRICVFYGKSPQFFLTSATIANASEHAQKLIEAPVTPIAVDGSPRGKKHFILYNPPIINPDLGIRRSVISECNLISQDLLTNQVQTIVFSRSRREVEVILRNLLDANPADFERIRGYRSGYLPRERRVIEEGLRSGEIRLVVSTNALELGVDIGGMDAILLVGYPGTIASVRQQAGRAGRRQGSSLAVFLASLSPLDQYLAYHPEYLFERSPEQALIDPDNPLILLEHIRAAAFELPFITADRLGSLPPEKLGEYLEYLKEEGCLVRRGERYFWMADQYPSSQVSLRNASPTQISLRAPGDSGLQTIGEVDFNSALWMVHEDAVYLQEGQQYLVEKLDLEAGEAILRPNEFDYYTLPQTETQIAMQNVLSSEEVNGGRKSYGELLVSSKVAGYKKIRWETQEVLGVFPILDLPTTELQTTGYWLQLNEATVQRLKSLGMWSSEPNEYGRDWEKIRFAVRVRDAFRCQGCGKLEAGQEFHVHHRVPFRQFLNPVEANRLENLVTLCPTCHMKAEAVLRIRSGLSGCRYALSNLAPLFLMCDLKDLGSTIDVQCAFADGQPTIILYDQVPGGIGLSQNLYQNHAVIFQAVQEMVKGCGCKDGCPACVGAAGMEAEGGKMETLSLLECLIG